MNYKTLTLGQNACPFTAYESTKALPLFPSVGCFTDTQGRLRFVVEGKSGLLVERTGHKTYTIAHVYTIESEQRKGYAKGLLAVARHTLKGYNVLHSENLTESGRLFAKA